MSLGSLCNVFLTLLSLSSGLVSSGLVEPFDMEVKFLPIRYTPMHFRTMLIAGMIRGWGWGDDLCINVMFVGVHSSDLACVKVWCNLLQQVCKISYQLACSLLANL